MSMEDTAADQALHAIVGAWCDDPFAILGMHAIDGVQVVRAFLPQAAHVDVVDAATGDPVATLTRVHPDGFFAGTTGRSERFPYRLRVRIAGTASEIDDPYRFGPVLGDVDLFLLGEGTHERLYDKFGAHATTIDGVAGFTFVVWAPNARRVSVVGDFNDWDGRRHPMRRRTGGVWELFLPGIRLGARYKYELLGQHGLLPLKADPFAFACERPPATASIVAIAGGNAWHDDAWIAHQRADADRYDAPIAIYEVHLGSWRRADGNRYLTYDELADQLIPYVKDLGFTHIELMPIAEHPFDGSWGYQTIGMYAPTSRFGPPDAFARFVDRAHAAGLGVLIDWVPGHFPTDAHGLGHFDGTALYEHADPRQGFQPDWNTLIFNFGRHEVANFLLANALFWVEMYHVDGLRVDAVASMLYLDYSRRPGEWIPNRYGGRENLDAIELLKRLNMLVYGEDPGVMTVAEESTSWPRVSHPVYAGGLGFGYKWNMGWMHDTLAYLHFDPIYRRYHQNELTFSFMYAFSENFVLPLSHDEVVHGKGSLLGKMSGDDWQRFANLRLLYGYMYVHPGKKLLFMGDEFAQDREWNHDQSLDWHVLDDERHRGVQALIRDCNALYRGLPALYERDGEDGGLEWIVSDHDASVVAFARRGRSDDELVVAVANFTPVVRDGYRIGVPRPGTYTEALNTDAAGYAGSGVTNTPRPSDPLPWHDKAQSIAFVLPPLATVVFRWER